MDDRNLALYILCGETVEVHCACVEVAALTTSGQIELRNCLKAARLKRVHQGEVRAQSIILDHHSVGDQRSIPAPHPVAIERELAGCVDAAAEQPVARVLVARIDRGEALFECTRVGLEDT